MWARHRDPVAYRLVIVFESAAAEALKKWDGARAPRGERQVAPSQLLGPGLHAITKSFFFENIGANLCNMVHLGVKIRSLNNSN